MTNTANSGIDPEVQRAMDAVHLPEVQQIIQELSKYGLAVAVPHAHGDEGDFMKLPRDMVAHEAGLQITFRKRDDPSLANAVPVMWRWDDGMQKIAWCATCNGQCCISV